ncbi:ADP-heptose--lipooligosaccharide heptosyltransferase II [hydrothermal vent metagenome]|uniref:lipopolysaccharide heptosyltransferase II n=1 Tax=hydrothermal vent metagenome TaxID=652676 RepID=A0A3B1ADC2_9ZZZZ
MVMAQSLFIHLKKQNPNIKIDVLAPEWSVALIARMPQVSTAISLAVKHGVLDLKIRYKTAVRLRQNNYQQAIITPRSIKAALLPFFAKIPQRTGYRGEHRYGLLNDIRPLNKKLLTQTVQRYVFLGNTDAENNTIPVIDYPKLEVKASKIKDLLHHLKLNLNKPIIALLPGAEYGPAKQWPVEYFKELATKVTALGFQVWVMGSEKDKTTASQIIDSTSDTHFNLCGKTALVDVVDLLSLVQYAVSNDSGLMHVACATNVTVIALYGSSSPSYTPPLHQDAIVMYKNLECSPCFKRQCQFKHLNCLKHITVAEVLEKIKQSY